MGIDRIYPYSYEMSGLLDNYNWEWQQDTLKVQICSGLNAKYMLSGDKEIISFIVVVLDNERPSNNVCVK